VLLAEAAAMVRYAGFEVGNLDVTLILESTKMKD
jgi:2C-methyl-D-erythritol 2,4-cyclodiphosphate synthase